MSKPCQKPIQEKNNPATIRELTCGNKEKGNNSAELLDSDKTMLTLHKKLAASKIAEMGKRKKVDKNAKSNTTDKDYVIANKKTYGPDKELVNQFEKFSEVLKKIEDPYEPEMMHLLLQVKAQIDKLLPVNELGILMKPEEVEVKYMLDRVENGEQILPYYPNGGGDIWRDPLHYLEDVLGKYLKYFNKKEDYLYLFQLRVINKKFCRALEDHFRNYPESGKLSSFIKTKSGVIDKQRKMIDSGEAQQSIKTFNKVFSIVCNK